MFVIQYLNNVKEYSTFILLKLSFISPRMVEVSAYTGVVQSPAARLNECNGPFNHSSTPFSHNHGNVDRTHS